MSPGKTATYLYCLLRSSGPPPQAGAPPGLPGAAPPRLLEAAAGLWLVVADVPLPDYGQQEIEGHLEDLAWVSERALAHEAVVEHFVAAPALLPAKLFTLFTDDRRALDDVRRRRESLDALLERVAGRVEWGVRVRFDPARVAAEDGAGGAGGDEASAPSGTDFLRRKKRHRDAGRRAAGEARAAAEEAFEALAARAIEARRRPVPEPAGARLLLDAAFLVPAREREHFEAEADASARRLAEAACDLTLSGPWPPYHFVAEEEEEEQE